MHVNVKFIFLWLLYLVAINARAYFSVWEEAFAQQWDDNRLVLFILFGQQTALFVNEWFKVESEGNFNCIEAIKRLIAMTDSSNRTGFNLNLLWEQFRNRKKEISCPVP